MSIRKRIFEALDNFVILCSGADLTVVRQPEFRGELQKFRGRGISVIMSSQLASLSIAYATYLAFPSSLVSILAYFAASLVVVSQESLLHRMFDGRRRRSTVVPLVLGLLWGAFLTIIITLPLELRLFQQEIARSAIGGDGDLSLLEQIQVLERLSKDNSAVEAVRWWMRILFFMLSTAPLIVRWLALEGPYDVYVELRDKRLVERMREEELESVLDAPGAAELKRALDDVNQTAERIIMRLDQSHEMVEKAVGRNSEAAA